MKVLVVDDEIAGLKTLELFVKKLGHQVITASDGEEAWHAWQNERPQVVITDWLMPKMSGVELCSKIRSNDGDDYTYIIMVTVQSEREDIVTGLESGADDYLIKPIDRAELHARLSAGERVLNLQSKDLVIFALAKLAESRDTETGNHLERIRHYCRTLAEAIHDSPDCPQEVNRVFIDNIFLTSPLHDIGKVGIPDHILLKPGRLDDREFEIMKKHVFFGYETLNEALKSNPRAGFLRMSAEIALSHHEKWDGTGYPQGIEGENIPLAARILSVADVYDALVSKRAYKDAFSHETAEAIIVDGEGTHFDPLVIQAFKRRTKEFAEIHRRFIPIRGEEIV